MADAVTPDRSYAAVGGGLDIPLQEAMLTQRAVRRVLPDPVDDEIVLRCRSTFVVSKIEPDGA